MFGFSISIIPVSPPLKLSCAAELFQTVIITFVLLMLFIKVPHLHLAYTSISEAYFSQVLLYNHYRQSVTIYTAILQTTTISWVATVMWNCRFITNCCDFKTY